MPTFAPLAHELGVHERTLRRGAVAGWVRCVRTGQRSWWLTPAEEDWLRRHWDTITALRDSFRRRADLRLAVLHGPAARWDACGDEPLRLLVNDAPGPVLRSAAAGLTHACGRPVAVEPLVAVAEDPRRLLEVILTARPLRDLDGVWPEVLRKRRALVSAAAGDRRALDAGRPW